MISAPARVPFEEETIAAISTPFGESGVGIVRLSGPRAESIVLHLFKPKKEFTRFISHFFHYGEIIDPRTKRPVDETLVVLMKGPKTYTREDIAEIHCHGGYLVLQRVLELVLDQGARMARPGEFTKKAFLNGRIDLTQAEAVIDLIRAKTTAGLDIANQQLRGMFYREMMAVKESLIDRLALVEAHIDFPEEEIEPVSLREMKGELNETVRKLEGWIASYDEGRIFREGVSCAIIGRTNVGKSSLLNVLLREDRAIVTPVPGTTRDVIEEVLNIQGIPVRLVDTAGLRKTADLIEQEGVRRTREKMEDADLILLVIDGSREIGEEDREIVKKIEGKKKIIVLNKTDLPPKVRAEDAVALAGDSQVVRISALKDERIDDLRKTIYRTLLRKEIRASLDEVIIANVRHRTALVQTRDNLVNAIKRLEEGSSPEFAAFELRGALEALGELVGETTSEEVLDRIFGRFCIGK